MLVTNHKLTVAEETVKRIADMIQEGDYAPGDRLPGERKMAEQLKVGRTSVREAIRRLETIGLVESRHGLGTYVKAPGSELIQASFIPHLLTDQATLDQLFDLREIIEVEAAARAASRANPDQIATMKKWMKLVESRIAQEDVDGLMVADVGFHRQIIIATGNDILVDLMDSMVDVLRAMRFDSPKIPELLPEIISGHRAIVKAIEAHDSGAARQAMLDHLAGVSRRVKRFWLGDQ
ncbi:MAG TPA: FadR/GntR family transcriptional regulator [Anaerolineae bacterium]|nr:FadR/GntR family transcriptional regulator [Anaerolineae bacterium]HMR66673.1 FadR/GntR family transcriptional regulator [Anaerolineae bacterium]